MESNMTIDYYYYTHKPTMYDRIKKVKSWRITRNTMPQPKCYYCRRPTSHSLDCFRLEGTKSMKKTKRWRGQNKFDFVDNVKRQIDED